MTTPVSGDVLFVGILQPGEHDLVFMPTFLKHGKAPSAWSFRLKQDQHAWLEKNPHLYVYRGTPVQRIVERYRIVDRYPRDESAHTRVGRACPAAWDDGPDPWSGQTRLTDGKPIQQWFKLDSLEPLSIPLDKLIEHLKTYVRPDGVRAPAPANPSAHQSSFALWDLR